MTSVFLLSQVSYRYPGAGLEALTEISLEVDPGVLYAVLGPNGSGKSTLLQVMLGELPASTGSVRFGGEPVRRWSRRAMARRIAFVPQSEPLAFPLTVQELVEMGRYPHLGVLGRAGARDAQSVQRAMERARVAPLGHRSIHTLSGGERQRARIARALAQEPSTLVLDEPTAALDLRYEMETFQLLKELAEESGLTVVVATHNLNLAARFASTLVLLDRGRIQAAGSPSQVLTHEILEQVYQWPVVVTPHPGPGPDTGAPQVLPLNHP